jgi:hypothetical protein
MTYMLCLSTFSIVGYDPPAQEWGIAVQSKFLAVGAVVPWASWRGDGSDPVTTMGPSRENTTLQPGKP